MRFQLVHFDELFQRFLSLTSDDDLLASVDECGGNIHEARHTEHSVKTPWTVSRVVRNFDTTHVVFDQLQSFNDWLGHTQWKNKVISSKHRILRIVFM